MKKLIIALLVLSLVSAASAALGPNLLGDASYELDDGSWTYNSNFNTIHARTGDYSDSQSIVASSSLRNYQNLANHIAVSASTDYVWVLGYLLRLARYLKWV